MMQHDLVFSEAVAAAVTEIERTTDAELIVVTAPRSGSYRDVSATGASVIALAVAVALILSPWHVAIGWFTVDVALVWLVAERLLRGRAAVRLLTRPARRQGQVQEAAEREFVRGAVHGTPNRSGVLIYVSALEDVVTLIPDLGVDGKVPQAELAAVREQLNARDLEHFLAGLRLLGAVLSARLPTEPGSDAFDLPNEPRILA